MTTFMLLRNHSRFEYRVAQRFWLIALCFICFGCEVDHLLDDSDGRLKKALEAAQLARTESPLGSGSSLKADLTAMMSRPLTSRIDALNGAEQVLSLDVRLTSEQVVQVAFEDRWHLKVDESGHWNLDHRTKYQELGERTIEDARRCRWINSRFFTGTQTGPMKEHLRLSDEAERCLNGFQDTLTTFVRLALSSSRVSSIADDLPDSGIIQLSLTLDPALKKMRPPLPTAWRNDAERSKAIWGPRDTLMSSYSVLESVDGSLTIEEESGIMSGANLKIRAGFTKMNQPVVMTVTAKQNTNTWAEKVVLPSQIVAQKPRQRIFKEREALLGIPIPKLGGKGSALPAPGDAPRLVLTSKGTLTTAPTKPSEAKPESAVDGPLTEDYDEDVP